MTTDSPSEARDRAIETVARAIHHSQFPLDDGTRWDRCSEMVQNGFRRDAAAALDALLACEGTGKRPALIEELAGTLDTVTDCDIINP